MDNKNNQTIWPNEKKFAVCLTHDVDRVHKTYQKFTRLIRKPSFQGLEDLVRSQNTFWNFEYIIDLEKSLGVTSTFFFLDESIKLNPLKPKTFKLSVGRYDLFDISVSKMIKRLDSSGWDIALHGSYNSFNNLELLIKEKKRLECIVGHEIVGIRQHYLNLANDTWLLQHQAGFRYDCSFGLTKGIGFKDNITLPFRPPGTHDFIVLPLGLMDYCLLTSKGDITQEYISLLNQVEENGGIFVINWHQERMNPTENPQYTDVYSAIIKECKHRNAWIANCGEIYSHLLG